MRIGIDVGGTNPDTVPMDETDVLSWCQPRTTTDASSWLPSSESPAGGQILSLNLSTLRGALQKGFEHLNGICA
jgi:N-methylhydantoinase A/oxoprolinase/acetone carboxylase beta subunit